MWLWYLEFNTGSTLIWVRLISSWKKFTKLKNLQVIKFFCFSDSQKKNAYRNWVKTSQSLKKFCNFSKSWVIRFSIVQIVRTKMVAEVVRRAGVKILKCFWQNTPWPDTGKNVLIVQPFIIKFYFSGWSIQWPPYQDHPCWLLWSRGLD